MTARAFNSGATLGNAPRLFAYALAGTGLLTLSLSLAGRVPFAWPLEWMEGASLQHALRLLHAEPLYASPSATFIPFMYPPLAYVPMALAAAALGPSLLAARIASLLCTLGSLVMIGRAGARAAGHPLGGWLAAGMFAMGFGYCGAFLDLARVDACFILLVLIAAERLQAGRSYQALFWLALCAFAKQHGLLLLLAASLALLLESPRRHAAAVALSLLLVLAAYAGLELATAGWFGRYTLELPLSHGIIWRLFFSFFVVDLLLCLPVLVLSTLVELRRRARAWVPFDALLCAAVLVSALGRAHAGGHDNIRLPAFALLCIAGTAPLARYWLASNASARTRLLASSALALQLAMLWQSPNLHRPPKTGATAFATLRATLQRCARGGPAVALDYALLTGEPFLNTMALSDLRMSKDIRLARAGTAALLSTLDSQRAPAALAVGEVFPALERVLVQRYHECARVPAPRLATGYSPGLFVDRQLVQIVYARNLERVP